jgi:hypothetical protein
MKGTLTVGKAGPGGDDDEAGDDHGPADDHERSTGCS